MSKKKRSTIAPRRFRPRLTGGFVHETKGQLARCPAAIRLSVCRYGLQGRVHGPRLLASGASAHALRCEKKGPHMKAGTIGGSPRSAFRTAADPRADEALPSHVQG